MQNEDALRSTLARLDGRGYKAYKDLRGATDFGPLTLFIDHVQGDPFAAPSKLRLRLDAEAAGWPEELQSTPVRRVAFADYLARRFRDAIGRGGPRSGSGKSGIVQIDAGGQEVLERTAARVEPGFVEVRIEAGLPANGRRISGRAAATLLCETLPALADSALVAADLDTALAFVECVENQEHLRSQLEARGLVAFIGDGAILPRESGASERPLRSGAIPFEAPESLRVELALKNPIDDEGEPQHHISGLGVRSGITLIVGGGYHGKSTLLRAIERGVYPHIPGDGREHVVAHPALVKIRAEDGRRVERVDISAFVSDLPGGRTTHDFVSDDASGSTSQAANIVEALEAGAHGLLLDEDTCATNFMMRDARMQALVHPDHEPITPFLDRVGALYSEHQISSILVMGGCGDYFDVADHVLRMHDFRPEDATAEAKAIAASHKTSRRSEAPEPIQPREARIPLAESFDASRGRRDVKIDVKTRHAILYGRELIELRGVEQLVDASQTRAIGHAIHYAAEQLMDGTRSLAEILDALETWLNQVGLDALNPFHHENEHPGRYARPRRQEIAATINRLRTLKIATS